MKNKSDFNWGDEKHSDISNIRTISIWFIIIIFLGAVGLWLKKDGSSTEKIVKGSETNKIIDDDNKIIDNKIYTTVVGPFSSKTIALEFAMDYKKQGYPVEFIEDQTFIQVGKYTHKAFAVSFSNKLKKQGYFCSIDEWKKGEEIRITPKDTEIKNNDINKNADLSKSENNTVKKEVSTVSKKDNEIKKNEQETKVSSEIKEIPKQPLIVKNEVKNENTAVVNSNIKKESSIIKDNSKKIEEKNDPIAKIIEKNVQTKDEIKEKVKDKTPDPIAKIIAQKEQSRQRSYWTVQIGAYNNKGDAVEASKEFLKKGIKTTIFELDHKYKYRVESGVFNSKEECSNSEIRKKIIQNDLPEYVTIRKF